MKKLINYLAGFVLTVALSVLAYVGYLHFYPVKVFDINSIYMITPKVKAGNDAIYYVDYCRYFSGNIHVFKTIDGPSLIYVPDAVNANPAGCRTAEVSLNIPTYAVPGTYRIKIVSEAQVNLIKKVTVRFQTDTFEVIK